MEFKLPEIGEGVYEAELVSWLVKPGDEVRRGQALMELMTDKATMEVPSPFGGTITELRAEPGQQIKVGEPCLSYEIGTVTNGASRSPELPTSAPQKQGATPDRGLPSAPASVASPRRVKAAPSVRLMARKLGIDLADIPGTGPEGRILMDDLAGSSRRTAVIAPTPTAKATTKQFGEPGTRVKIVGLRRRIAEQMVTAKRHIPHYSYVDEFDASDLVRLRNQLKEPLARSGVKLTYLAFVVKAVVGALREFPIVNSTLDEQSQEIVFHDRYDIGFAAATPAGLSVPVLKSADRGDLVTLAREIDRLSNAVRSGGARREELTGGTFTITSIGNIGGLFATPVINHPQVGIVGIGRIVRRPVYDETGNIRPADMLYLSFSFDHRVVDGDVGAMFGNAVIRRLRNPAALLLTDPTS